MLLLALGLRREVVDVFFPWELNEAARELLHWKFHPEQNYHRMV